MKRSVICSVKKEEEEFRSLEMKRRRRKEGFSAEMMKTEEESA